MLSNFASHIISLRCVATAVGRTLSLIGDWLIRLGALRLRVQASSVAVNTFSLYVREKLFDPLAPEFPMVNVGLCDQDLGNMPPASSSQAPILFNSPPGWTVHAPGQPAAVDSGVQGLYSHPPLTVVWGVPPTEQPTTVTPTDSPTPALRYGYMLSEWGECSVTCGVGLQVQQCSPPATRCFVSLPVLLPSRPLV